MYTERLLNTDERIRLLRRPHPASVARPALAGLLMALVAFGLLLLAGRLDSLDSDGGTGALLNMLGDEPRWTLGWLALGLLLAGLLICGLTWLSWRSTEYAVVAGANSGRLLRVSGILSKHASEAPLEKINDLVLVEPLWGRLLGYGDIQVKTGNDYSGQVFAFVPDPRGFYAVTRSLRPQANQPRQDGPVSNW